MIDSPASFFISDVSEASSLCCASLLVFALPIVSSRFAFREAVPGGRTVKLLLKDSELCLNISSYERLKSLSVFELWLYLKPPPLSDRRPFPISLNLISI